MARQENAEKTPEVESDTVKNSVKTCGIVMPIAPMLPEYDEIHWKEVSSIITQAADTAGYKARLVSESESINIIQKDIVQNLYTDEIVICDVSGRNPNVLFELGMRLTFDKPTIIIKDDCTNYIFDIGVIKHLEYPKDLNYHAINRFMDELSKKIIGTVKAYADPKFTTFLKHFKDIKITPAKLEQEEVSESAAILNTLFIINKKLDKLESKNVSMTLVGNSEILLNDNTIVDVSTLQEFLDSFFKKLSDSEMKKIALTPYNGLSKFVKSLEEVGMPKFTPSTEIQNLYTKRFVDECRKRNIAPF